MFGKVEELVVLLIIILVLFGAKKLPELSKGIADSIKEVRKGFHDEPAVKSAAAEPKPANSQNKA
jgi:sec-independent protein translocase protein TatA